jgi:hypothetical protein
LFSGLPDPHPEDLRIRIRYKMSRIPNTDFLYLSSCRLDESGNVMEFLLPVKEEVNSEGEREERQEEEASHTKR